MRIAIYRIHYGIEFLKQSIESIYDAVDKIFVIYSLYPWVYKETVNYCGSEIPMPALHENVDKFIYTHFGSKSSNKWYDEKIITFRCEISTPLNQFRLYYDMCMNKFINKFKSSNYHDTSFDDISVPLIEPDMIFYKPDVKELFQQIDKETKVPCLSSLQIELWKNESWIIPSRPRIGPTIWKPKRQINFTTNFGTYNERQKYISSNIKNYNFGFCFSNETMLYKHLTAINFSSIIGDSIPSHEWYKDKWLNWTPDTTDLEISEKYKHLIHKAEPYSMPIEMLKQIGKNI